MRVVSNIKESSVQLWKIPAERIAEIRQAYDNREWLWLISIWNEYGVTRKICSGCPDSIDVVKAFIPTLWISQS